MPLRSKSSSFSTNSSSLNGAQCPSKSLVSSKSEGYMVLSLTQSTKLPYRRTLINGMVSKGYCHERPPNYFSESTALMSKILLTELTSWRCLSDYRNTILVRCYWAHLRMDDSNNG